MIVLYPSPVEHLNNTFTKTKNKKKKKEEKKKKEKTKKQKTKQKKNNKNVRNVRKKPVFSCFKIEKQIQYYKNITNRTKNKTRSSTRTKK